MKKFIIIDTFALMFRAYYALPDLKTQAGLPSGAVFGMGNFIIQILDMFRPDYVIAVKDMAAKTFRHEQFEAYKANRTEAPDNFKVQIEHVFRLIESFGIPLIGIEGFEADDLAGTLSRRIPLEYDDMDVVCVTGDQDYLQLVNERVTILTPQIGFNKTKIYDRAAVFEKLGVYPEQVVDYKSLKGDTSDNVPGVPGIGEKTASMLLQRFGTLEDVYANIDSVEGKLREKLIMYKDQALMCRHLVQLDLNVSIENFDLQEAVFTPEHFQNVEAVLAEYDCFSVVKKLRAWRERLNDGTVEGEWQQDTSAQFRPLKSKIPVENSQQSLF